MPKSIKKNLKWPVGLLVLLPVLVPVLFACTAQVPQAPTQPIPIRFAMKLNPNEPGCGGLCHQELAPEIEPNPEGKYTLAYEANQAYAGHNFDPLGKLLALKDCWSCHAVGTGDRIGRGNVANKHIRDIVHDAHLENPYFTVEVDGKESPRLCFTCHRVSGSSSMGLYE